MDCLDALLGEPLRELRKASGIIGEEFMLELAIEIDETDAIS